MITHQQLLEIFSYDPETGVFTRLTHRSKKYLPGSQAGTIDKKGYLIIQIDGVRYLAHRLAWFYMTREWPRELIDHEDRNTSNNIWTNLREATRSQNQQNSKTKRISTTGVKGVTWHAQRRKFRAEIRIPERRIHIGLFTSIQEASDAIRVARLELHGTFAHHG